MKRYTKLTFIILALFCYQTSFATVFTAIADGNWHETSTWDQGSLPTSGDTVVIDGYTVSYNSSSGNVTIKRLEISNASGVGNSYLIMTGDKTLTVLDDIEATANNISRDVFLQLKNDVILNVNGNIAFERVTGNIANNKLKLNLINQSRLNVTGDFTFDYNSSGPSELDEEVLLEDSATFTVGGNTYLTIDGGIDLLFTIKENASATFDGDFNMSKTGGNDLLGWSESRTAHFYIKGNVVATNSGGTGMVSLGAGTIGGYLTVDGGVSLNSTDNGKNVQLISNGGDVYVEVKGDISMNAVGDADVKVVISNRGLLALGGNINRPTKYGSLTMFDDSWLEFNGSKSQSIPPSNLDNSGTDSLFITNVSISNTSDLALQGPLRIQDTLSLTNGNLISHDTALLILEDNATISGGGKSSFIEGPVRKLGRTNGTSFIFPLGDDGTYAPIKISEITSADSEVTTRYYSDPPPFGNVANFDAGVDNISGNGYWDVEKNSDAGNLDITLYWNDAGAQGINDIASLVVLGLNPATETWESYGQESFTGAIGAGSSGSVSSSYSDPPPFGVIKFTIGSTTGLNQLPVELTKFEAVQQQKQVALNWQTATEVNSSHFIIERSVDGFNFERIASVDAQGDNNTIYNYSFMDKNPYQGLNYYRLKMVDLDLSFEYSQIEVVKFDKDANLIIYPNPVNKTLNIQGNSSFDGETQMEVFNRSGQQIFSGMVDFENGKLQINVDVLNVYSTGTYFIKITNYSGNYILKFVKVE